VMGWRGAACAGLVGGVASAEAACGAEAAPADIAHGAASAGHKHAAAPADIGEGSCSGMASAAQGSQTVPAMAARTATAGAQAPIAMQGVRTHAQSCAEAALGPATSHQCETMGGEASVTPPSFLARFSAG